MMMGQILKLSPLLNNLRNTNNFLRYKNFVRLDVGWKKRYFASGIAEEAPENPVEGFHNEVRSVLRKTEPSGLYGFDVLKTPKGFHAFVQEAIDRSVELISYIKDLAPSEETIHVMDEISDTICTVVDSAELCRNTHPDKDYVEEANKASMKLYEYLHVRKAGLIYIADNFFFGN